MNLNQYEKQQIPRRHTSVKLEPNEYNAYYIGIGIIGIHIFKYPDYSYYLDNESGYIKTIKGAHSVFKIDTSLLDRSRFPDNFKFAF